MGTVTGYAARMGATLTVGHYALPGLRTGTRALIGCSCVLAMLSGIARKRPANRVPGLVPAIAGLCAIAGQLTRKLRATTDVLIMTIGAGVLAAWALLVRPYEVAPELSVLRKVLAIAFPVGDVIILWVPARLLATATSSSAPRPTSALCCSPSCRRACGT